MKTANVCCGFVILVLLASVPPADAQEEIFFLGQELGVGARAMSMGGAYVGIADDYTAIYWNPAGLGQLRRMEANVGFSHNKVTNESAFFDEAFKGENTFTRLNSLGFVFPVPTYQGSLVFGIGYNRVRDFDNTLEVEGFNPEFAAYPHKVMPTYSDFGWTTTIDDSLFQTESLIEDGSLNHFSLAGALEVQKDFFVGVTVNFVSGSSNYNLSFSEDDIYQLYDEPFDEEQGVVADLEYWKYNQTITSDFRATNVKLGAFYNFGRTLKLGATVITPTKYKIRETWSENFEETYLWGSEEPYTDAGEYEYTVEEPYGFDFGASFQLLNILLSAGMEFKDWSQAKFHDEPPVAGSSKVEVNNYIKRELKSVAIVRLGAEMYVPIIRANIRLGYFNRPSAYRHAEVLPDKEFLSGGVSLMLDRQVKIDVSLVHGSWEQETIDALTNVPAVEDKTFDKIIGTLSIRF